MKKIISIILVICSFVMLLGGCGEPKEIYLKPEEEATVNFFKRKYKSIDEGEEESIKNEVVEFLTFEGKDGVAKLNRTGEIVELGDYGVPFYVRGRNILVYNQKGGESFLEWYDKKNNSNKTYLRLNGYYSENIFYWSVHGGLITLSKVETDLDGIFGGIMGIKIRKLKNILKSVTYNVISVTENGLYIKIDLKDVPLSTFSKNEGKYKKINLYFCKNEGGEIVTALFDFKFDFGKDDYGEGVYTWQTNITPKVDINDLDDSNLEHYQGEGRDNWYQY